MKRLIAVLTAGAMGAAVLTGCGGGQTAETAGESTSAAETAAEAETTEADSETGEENASSLDKLVFTYVTSPLNVPSIIERDQGIFADVFGDMGISVEYAEITSGADQTQALASGDGQIL